ncbi:MAG TPA: DUF5666 domain-containing protein [Balneolaceae bacterium]|nr:DUF5666 domain-containing protein [Balneolaceae bacterium]
MKNLLKSSITSFASLLAILLLFSGCSINDSNTTASEELTEEELEVAGQIIAESLSDQKDGIFASLNDAFTLPSSNGFNQGVQASKLYSSAVFNAAANSESSESQNNYSYTYDPATGKHLVSFSRTTNRPDFSKESSADLEYIYLNSGGDFIASPRIENEEIGTINYSGIRSGSIITPNQNSSYQRADTLIIQGLNGGAELLTIDGQHEGSGSFKATRDDGTEIERDYELTVEFLDVVINNSTVETNGNLEKGVNGALAYEMVITKTVNGDESIKTVNGTIEFNGDGTALLRFRNILEDFKIQLGDGDLLGDDEFNGFVRSIDSESNTFTLFNGQTYLLTDDTDFIAESDLLDLNEVGTTLENDIRVATNGRFIQDEAGTNLVRSVTFNYEREDVEFEDNVESVDLENRSFTLNNGLVLFMDDETEIDDEDDGLTNIQAVQSALSAGNSVEAEGEFDPAPNGTNIVNEVSFEFEEQEFESFVELVSTENSSFTLADGKTYVTDENTEFDDDIVSIEQLNTIFQDGLKIKAEGEYYFDSEGTRIVLSVEFESEDFEENEFEGIVESVNSTDRSFTLDNGLVLFVNEDTKYEDDIQSFNQLATEFTNGEQIEAEGEYYIDSSGSEDRNFVIKVELEVEGDDDDDDGNDGREEIEFEDELIESVDPSSKTITLDNGLLLLVDQDSDFDDGDINSIGELHGALMSGLTAKADGEYYIDEDDNNVIIEIDFELTGNRGNGDDDDDDGDDGDENGDDEDSDDDGDEENEFGGRINSVDLSANTFELMNGRTYILGTDVEIDDDGDLSTLDEVATDINEGFVVTTEGIYEPQEDGSRVVVSVKFESNRNDDDDDDDSDDSDDREDKDFDGDVQGVDLINSTFTLNSGLILTVDGNTEFDDEEIASLDELDQALEDGLEVEAEGEYYTNSDGNNIVIEVEFDTEGSRDDDDDDNGDDSDDDSDDDGDDDSDDSDDREDKDFDGDVQGVDLNNSTFTLNSGLILTVDGNTEFDDDEIRSLSELADALADGLEADAEGEYYTDSDGNNIVIEVEFDIEGSRDDDDDDDGDDGDDDSDDREEKDFDGEVSAIDEVNSSFTVGNLTFEFPAADIIDEDSEITTFDQLVDAFNNPDLTVEAYGEYYTDSEGNNILLEVEFETEGSRDDDDDDNNGNGNGDDDSDDDDDEDDDEDDEDDEDDDDDDD